MTAVDPGWLTDFLGGKTIESGRIDHDSFNGVIRIALHLEDGATLNLTANYGEADEQDAVIDWEVVWPTPRLLGSITAAPGKFAVLVCRDCDDAEIPFPSEAERGRWASAHTEATGHRSFRVFES